MLQILNKKLVHENQSFINDHKIFYMKLRADYQRYLLQFVDIYSERGNFQEELQGDAEFKKSGHCLVEWVDTNQITSMSGFDLKLSF